MAEAARGLLPPLLLTALGFWAGTLNGAASGVGATVTHSAVLGFSLLAVADLRDPLSLGRRHRWLPPALVLLALLSCWLSPVPRAGRVGLLLLPAFLLLPAAAARCWRGSTSLRAGLLGLSLAVWAASLTALLGWRLLPTPRAALPLGHHTLLAGWLVMLLPLALLPWREGGPQRWLATASGVTAVAALLASGSLLGGLALAAEALLAACWWPRLRRLLVVGGALLLLVCLPRLARVSAGADLSTQARLGYLAAGWRGVAQRPLWGWGPGAVPWTVAEHLRPREGVNPAGETVGDLHSLPAQIAYELGVPGLAVAAALALVFARRRWRGAVRRPGAEAPRVALIALAGGAVMALGSAPLAVPALPAAAAVVAGCGLAVERRLPPGPAGRLRRGWILYPVAAAGLLLPLDRAQLLYDGARAAGDHETALARLRRARDLDPDFPLYRARAAWMQADLGVVTPTTAEEARRAALAAHASSPLWLVAGHLGRLTREPWAPAALERAWRLDPLSPLTAFHLLAARPEAEAAAELGASAVRSEPRLASAVFWQRHPRLAREVAHRTGIEVPAHPPHSGTSRALSLALSLDHDPAVSYSLYAFRRSPWPADLAPVQLATAAAAGTASASALSSPPRSSELE